jgi:hypothetical protein
MRWISAVCVALALTAPAAAIDAGRSSLKLLKEGTVFGGTDGTVTYDDANDVWRFELADDVNSIAGETVRTLAEAGARFELLPSVTLEDLVADVNDRQEPAYRLTATVTTFRGRNYLFASDHLPLSKLKDGTSQEPNQPEDAALPRPEDDESAVARAVPPEILARLQSRRVAQEPETGGPPRPRRPGHVMVDRVGLVRVQDGRPVFVPYALGWNLGSPYELLPCQTLEYVLARQAAAPDPLRFNVAGLVTEFQGRKYLLLQRAIRAYSYGNFGG